MCELLPEGCEPVVVQLDFSAFDELPCASVVGAFLDRVVYVADGDLILCFVVKDSLEWGDNLWVK